MSKVVVIGHIREEGLTLLGERSDLSLEVIEDDEAEPERLAEADAILVRTARLGAEAIAAAPRLKVVSRHGVGWDNVDIRPLNERRIPLCIAAHANMTTVAEHTFMMMLELAKDGRGHDRAVREGRWAYRNAVGSMDLRHRTLLLIGFGRIGREVARLAQAFGMAVHVFDPFIGDDDLEDWGCQRAPMLDAALGTADVVSLHMPLNDHTRHLIDAGKLELMKSSAILLNTSRGGLVDEAALAEAVAQGRIRGAGIDVFTEEPPAADNPLLGVRGVLLSPHIAGVTDASMIRMASEAARNILNVLDGKPDPAVIVNWAAIRTEEAP